MGIGKGWALCALAVVGCTPLKLAVPSDVGSAKEVTVGNYAFGTKNSFQRSLRIGSYEVTGIRRGMERSTTTSAGPWSKSNKKTGYSFDIAGQGRTLHGECGEATREQNVGMYGKTSVTLSCTCSEGSEPRVTLEFQPGLGFDQGPGGNVQVFGVPYDLTELHEAQGAPAVTYALGYKLRSAKGVGVVDLTDKGRAWIPETGSDEETLGLVCSYAALFLYWPDESL